MDQINGTFDQRLWSDSSTLLNVQFLLGIILPTAGSNYDSSSYFSLQSRYQRLGVDLELRADAWQWGVLGWWGSEAFGVRNQGTLIYNALETHQFGWTAKMGYQFTPSNSVQCVFSQESFLAYGVNSLSSTFLLGMSVMF